MWSKINLTVLQFVARLQLQREEGQALIEYTLILALVSIVAISLLTSVGTSIKNDLQSVVNAL